MYSGKMDTPVEWKVVPPTGPFGLLDTTDQTWLGDDNGPSLFDDYWMARVAAQVVDVRIGNTPGTTRAIPFREKSTTFKENVDTKMDSLTALKMIEDGKA